jgi:quercetin dioxygenase-like cupin family protein
MKAGAYRSLRISTWERYMESQGIPIIGGHGVTDVRGVSLAPWERMGGNGAFLELDGMEGVTGMYVVEIPPGGSLHPEHHVFDELIYILQGHGTTKVWNGRREDDGAATVFEWQEGTLFAPPMNTWHQMFNTSGTESAKLLAVVNAPPIVDLTHNVDFVFNCDYAFTDRFDGRPGFFEKNDRSFYEYAQVTLLETNLIPDARRVALDSHDQMGKGQWGLSYQMDGNVLVGHISDRPPGHWGKAHYHGGGAIILMLSGAGYTLLWPQEATMRPYENGHADMVERVDWREGSVISPPSGWFHQHFITSDVSVRQLALRMGSKVYGVKFHDIQVREGTHLSTSQGGTLIEYEDEDPEIKRQYERALEAERKAAGLSR